MYVFLIFGRLVLCRSPSLFVDLWYGAVHVGFGPSVP